MIVLQQTMECIIARGALSLPVNGQSIFRCGVAVVEAHDKLARGNQPYVIPTVRVHEALWLPG